MSEVFPHSVQVTSGSAPSGSELVANDPLLRVGHIVKVHAPSAETNTNKRYFEYDVKVEHYDSSGTLTRLLYPRCRLAPQFGGKADFRRTTFRKTDIEDKDFTKPGNGSQVLLLCVNGDSRDAVIIGGYHHPEAPEDDPSLGHRDYQVFNGLEQIVSDDGSFLLRFNGKTNADGTPHAERVEGAAGSTLAFESDGSIAFSTADGNQSFLFNHKDHRCTIITDTSLDVSSNGNVNILSKGVLIGVASDAFVLGTTYRKSESTLNKALSQRLTALSALIAAAGTSLVTAGGLMVVPVVGASLAAAPVLAAAAAISNMVVLVQQMVWSIDNFEAGAAEYLSDKNFTD